MGALYGCPFYRWDSKKSISCEDGLKFFDTKQDRDKKRLLHCCDNWWQCDSYKKLNRIYESEINVTERIREAMKENAVAELNSMSIRLGKVEAKADTLEKENEQLKRDIKAEKYRYDRKKREYDQCKADVEISRAKEKSLTMMIGYLCDKFNLDSIDPKEMTEFWGKYEVKWKVDDTGKIHLKKRKTC